MDGRVRSKTTLRQRSREKDSLAVFSFVIQDETGKITVTAWDEVATRLYDAVAVGACYRLTMYKVKEVNMPNASYNLTDHACEITLSKVRDFAHQSFTEASRRPFTYIKNYHNLPKTS